MRAQQERLPSTHCLAEFLHSACRRTQCCKVYSRVHWAHGRPETSVRLLAAGETKFWPRGTVPVKKGHATDHGPPMGLRCHANRYGYRQKASSDYLYDITKFKSLLGNTVELQKQ